MLPSNEYDYYMPAEWGARWGTWFSWPHNAETWPGARLDGARAAVAQVAALLSADETVFINAQAEDIPDIYQRLDSAGARLLNVRLLPIDTNDAWARDHGPTFVRRRSDGTLALIDWEYNAWGGKYPPFDADNAIPKKIARYLDLPIFSPGIVMEGGSIETNGAGVLLTTKSCLLNPNRNPTLSQAEIEKHLQIYLGVQKIIWLNDGIEGDDTDGHIDDLSRFTDENVIVTVLPDDAADEDYPILKENYERLLSAKNLHGNPFQIFILPTPAPVIDEGLRLPASYANFLIARKKVIVPIFDDPNDKRALATLQKLFPDRQVIGVNCRALVWGLGTIHCLTQQVPAPQMKR